MSAEGKVVHTQHDAHGIVRVQQQDQLGHLKRCRVQPLATQSLSAHNDRLCFVEKAG